MLQHFHVALRQPYPLESCFSNVTNMAAGHVSEIALISQQRALSLARSHGVNNKTVFRVHNIAKPNFAYQSAGNHKYCSRYASTKTAGELKYCNSFGRF